MPRLRTLLASLASVIVTGHALAQPVPLKPPPPATRPIALQPQPLLVGAGASDITGPVAEVGMMGYGKSDQITSGMYTRLWARAFVFANPTTNKRVVFVSAELGQLFSSVKQGVVKQLAAKYPGLYDDRNVQIAATHTHSGPGGYSHYAMYNITTKGFVKENYDVIVSGIVQAISQAHDSLGPGTATIAKGTLTNASRNRAPTAYKLDTDATGPDVNQGMTVLRVNRPIGGAVGVISWFPVHNTSFSRNNTMVSSDHKGLAALKFERDRGTILPFENPGKFVAAFPNGDEGDVSPNLDADFSGVNGKKEMDAAEIIGTREFLKAKELFDAANESLGGDVDFRHSFVNMHGLNVTSAALTNGAGGKTLCAGAYGVSFAAGAKDGPTGTFAEGMRSDQISTAALENVRRAAVLMLSPLVPQLTLPGAGSPNAAWDDACQRPKPVLIPSGTMGITPAILPFQILRVGSLAILGVPGEMTTVAGRRLVNHVQGILAPIGVKSVIITGLANEYSGYITTPEEYESQQYEGASTIYGKLTFDAYKQIFGQLAMDMAAGRPSAAGPTPQPLPNQIQLQTGVVADGGFFGKVIQDAPALVAAGQTVSVRFASGHPKNNLRTNDTYFVVEKKVGTSWQRVAWDAMPETRFTWRRDPACITCSWVDTIWDTPTSTSGFFRIRHFGTAKDLAGKMMPYEGTSREFEVRVENPVCPGLRATENRQQATVSQLQNQLGAMGREQQQCQAEGRKPAQCVTPEDTALKRQVQAQVQQAITALNATRTQKQQAGCVY